MSYSDLDQGKKGSKKCGNRKQKTKTYTKISQIYKQDDHDDNRRVMDYQPECSLYS